MIEYFEQLSPSEQEELTEAVKLLWNQTYVLEKKYNKSQNRTVSNPDFKAVDRHLAFLQEYFKISGVEVVENSQVGMIYLRGEGLVGDKLSRLATLYVLIMKLIYDEQLAMASASANVFTTLGDMHERLAGFRLMKGQPAPTEIRKALRFLKKYQIIEVLDSMEDTENDTRILIYPSISMILLGEDIRALLDSFKEMEREDAETEI